MLAPIAELREYTGRTQAAAVVRRLRALGAPATINARGLPAVPASWWSSFKAGHIITPPTNTPAANDEPNTLRLDRLPQGRRHRA